MTDLALLRFLGRGVARTARRIADFSEGAEKTLVNPRHFVSVDQLGSKDALLAQALLDIGRHAVVHPVLGKRSKGTDDLRGDGPCPASDSHRPT